MPDPAGIYLERAIAWAMDRVGSTAYALKRLGFAEDAFELANDIVLDGYGYAGEAAQAYGAADRCGAPPRGGPEPKLRGQKPKPYGLVRCGSGLRVG